MAKDKWFYINKFLIALFFAILISGLTTGCQPDEDKEPNIDGRPIVVPQAMYGVASVAYGICFNEHRPYLATESGFDWVEPVLDYCRSLEPNWMDYVYIVY